MVKKFNVNKFVGILLLTLLLVFIFGCSVEMSKAIVGKWYSVENNIFLNISTEGSITLDNLSASTFLIAKIQGTYILSEKNLKIEGEIDAIGSGEKTNFSTTFEIKQISSDKMTMITDKGKSIIFEKIKPINDDILGKWVMNSGDSYEFIKDGNLKIILADGSENTGTYFFLDNRNFIIDWESGFSKFKIEKIDDKQLTWIINNSTKPIELNKQK